MRHVSEQTAGEVIQMCALQEENPRKVWGASPVSQVLRVLQEAQLQPLTQQLENASICEKEFPSPGWSSFLHFLTIFDYVSFHMLPYSHLRFWMHESLHSYGDNLKYPRGWPPMYFQTCEIAVEKGEVTGSGHDDVTYIIHTEASKMLIYKSN